MDKDLHIIYGKNAIGKSYATYCVCCIIKNIKNKSDKRNSYYGTLRNRENEIEKVFDDLLKKLKKLKTKKLNITEDFKQLCELELNSEISEGIVNSFKNTFISLSNLKNRFTNTEYTIKLSSGRFCNSIII